jgi:histidinol-phosphate aminotransferase
MSSVSQGSFVLQPRACVAAMEEYSGPVDVNALAERLGVPVQDIAKLDGNENPYGLSPRVAEALASGEAYQFYYDADQTDLRRWISQYAGLPPEYVLAGNGADELIDLLMKAYLDPGDEVLDFQPSFGMYAFNAQQYDAGVVVVQRDERWEIDVDQALAALTPRTKIVILTSPNNPTGNLLPHDTIRALLASGRLVIVDEAYMEFSNGQTVTPWVPKYDNLVVLRTFSKWAGLAGLRIGYGLLPNAVARHLWKLKPPFNVNQAAVIAVRETLRDREYLMANVRKLIAERERLLVELSKLDFIKPYPSQANFILCEIVGREARALKDALEARGILIRHYSTPRIANCLRISIGRPDQNDLLLRVLRES